MFNDSGIYIEVSALLVYQWPPPGFGPGVFILRYNQMTIRSAFYIDGFNAYHALDRLNQPHLKWLDWDALAKKIIPSRDETLERVVMCTAIKKNDYGKRTRHEFYLSALEQKGVVCLKGHFAKDPRECRDCGYNWDAPVEKQGDVNLAISLIADAFNDKFDHCYLVTADGDQVATARMLRSQFPEKKITSVVIAGQKHNKSLLAECGGNGKTIKESELERALFPKLISGPKAILRPQEYDPPAGWVHPSNRPQKQSKRKGAMPPAASTQQTPD